eukprot:4373093-Amphidinium_carterae.1
MKWNLPGSTDHLRHHGEESVWMIGYQGNNLRCLGSRSARSHAWGCGSFLVCVAPESCPHRI